MTTLEPASVALKLAFLAVLYLFLLWVVRSAWKDLRRRGERRAPGGAGARRPPTPTRPACTAPTRRRARHGGRTASRGSWSSTRPGIRTGSPTRSSTARRSGAATSRSASRIRSPPRATRASSARARVLVLEDLGSTNGTLPQRGAARRAAAAAPRRPHPHRRQRVHVPAGLTDAARRRALREVRHRPSAPGQRGQLLRARAAVRRRRRDGRRAGRRGRLAARGRDVRRRPAGRRQLRAAARGARRARRTSASTRSRRRTARSTAWARRSRPPTSTATSVALAHVGDSRAYLLRDGELTRLTRDHTLVEELVRRGELTEQEAAEHPQRSIITRALGPEPDVDVDLHTHRVPRRRRAAAVQRRADGDDRRGRGAGDPERRGEPARGGPRLVDAANEAGGRDNITVVLFRLEEVGATRPATGAPTEGIEAGGRRASGSGERRSAGGAR